MSTFTGHSLFGMLKYKIITITAIGGHTEMKAGFTVQLLVAMQTLKAGFASQFIDRHAEM